jgi:nucleotide-binding universal stress UspA family protein
MKKFLVGVDGSDPSLHAVRKAAELASATKGKLVLAYALAPMTQLGEMYTWPSADLEESDRKNGETILRDAARVARELGCQAEAVLLEGSPAMALAEQSAQDPEVDMVVVGSRGRGAVASALLGSVTEKLVRISKKPVLVVH